MQNQLKKVIDFAKRTGDRVIVFDPENPESSYVLMGLEEYENLQKTQKSAEKEEKRGLTEDEILDNINRNIAIIKTTENDGILREEDNLYSSMEEAKSPESPIVKNSNFSEETDSSFARMGDLIAQKNKNPWKIPSTRKEAAEEIIEEDRQYLEFNN